MAREMAMRHLEIKEHPSPGLFGGVIFLKTKSASIPAGKNTGTVE